MQDNVAKSDTFVTFSFKKLQDFIFLCTFAAG